MAYEGLNNLGHQRQPGRGDPERQRPVLRPHGLPPVREPDPPAPPPRPQVGAVPRRGRPARPARGRQPRLHAACRACTPPSGRSSSRRRSSRASACATSARSTAMTWPAWNRPCTRPAGYDGPIVVHVLTQKGRGYAPAEDDDEKNLHDAPVFDPAIGPTEPAGRPRATPRRSTRPCSRSARSYAEVVAITAAMPGPTGLLPFQARWPDRFFDVGIAEQHAVTSAAGMAMGGLRPVVAVYSTFFSRAFDQANLDVGLHGLPVVFALDRAGITGDDGPSHHGVLDMALCLKMPGMTVFAPSSVQELAGHAAHRRRDWTVRPPSATRRERRAHVPDRPGRLGACRALRLREGDGEVCILAVGKMVEAAEEAIGILLDEGIDPTLWDVRVVRPLDPAMVTDAARHRLGGHRRGRRAGRRGGHLHGRRHRRPAGVPPESPGAQPGHADVVHPPRQARAPSWPSSASTARASPPPPRRPCSGRPPT